MKEMDNLSLKFLRRLTFFDWLAILVGAIGIIFLLIFVSKKEKWVKVEMKVSPGEWWWESQPPPYWIANKINKGDTQYNSMGQKIAEVLEIKTYELPDSKKAIYVTLNLKAEVDKRRRKLTFNHLPLEIGKPIDLEFERIGFPGIVIFIDGVPDTRVWEDKIVEVKVNEWSEIFPETLGILPWRAEAIKVGDQMKDSQGKVLVEVLEKKVNPADKIVTTSDGRVLLRQDPIKKDVVLVVRLQTLKQEGVDYFLDDFKVKVGTKILLSLPNIDVLPEITKIVE